MHKHIVLFFLLLSQAALFAQAPTLQTVKASIDNYAAKYPKEKVYVQYDKPAYGAGETVWFKAYILKGFETSDLSKNFYIDFTDTVGNVLMHGVYPVEISSAAGSFDIPGWYKGGNIHVRAYTRWMLNFDTTFLYNKDIRIIKTQQLNNYKQAAKPVQVAAMQFFPEGGDCIAGVKTKVAFKAIYQSGVPAPVRGIIVNSKGVKVDTIYSQHDGMGFFYLEAQPGETYTARWKDDKKNPYQTTPLPAIKSDGAALEIKPGKEKTGFIVKRSDNAADNYKQLHIVATMQQQVVYLATVKLDATSVIGGSIPIDQLPSGILQVTLFDANWAPMAERITFVNNNDYRFEPEVGFSALGLGKRGRNMLVINLPDTVESNLSVSVTDVGLGIDSSDDIISHMLLTGDLKGRVYHPSYYFSDNSDSVKEHLDLVMLTNGWRRYNWSDVLADKQPPLKYPKDSAYLTFGGKVFGATPLQLREAGSLFIMAQGSGKDTSKQFLTVPLNSDGTFHQPGMSFFDTLKVYYQFGSKSGSALNKATEVTFTTGGMPTPRHIFYDRNNLSYTYLDTTGDYRNSVLAAEAFRLEELLKQTTLANVTVTAKTKSKMQLMDEKYSTGLFSGGDPAAQFDLVNDPSVGPFDVLSYLTGKVAGLQITGSGTANVSATWRGSPTDVYVDEIKADLGMVSSMNIKDIAYVKVMRPPFFGSAGGGAGGAIAIYTRRGGDVKNDTKGGSLPYKTIAGYTFRKEFYSPNYGTINEMNSKEDVRSTLYWNPMIITSTENHILKFQFYNNDVTDGFRVIVEGVSRDGKLARIEKVYQ